MPKKLKRIRRAVPERSHLGSLELLVLLAISKLKDKAYGAGISKAIVEKTGIPAHLGAVYTSLTRLERKKLVKSMMGEATSIRGGRAKKYYSLSVEGKRVLDKSLTGIKKLAA
jgi:PadR family transcriptional regulator